MSLVQDQYLPIEYSQQASVLRGRTGPFVYRPSYWQSLSRPLTNPIWEILKISFRQPVVVDQLSFEVKRLSLEYEVFYTNRQDQVVPLLNSNKTEFEGEVTVHDSTQLEEWIEISSKLYPVIAKNIEIRLKRVPSTLPPDASYPISVRRIKAVRSSYRDVLINPHTDVDSLGNIVSRTVLDWDPVQAIDGAESTFWKSEPQPDPNAVVAFYVDCKTVYGESQEIDKIWIDPVYTGQQLNLYYSEDDTENQFTLSPTRIAPSSQVDAAWIFGGGMSMLEPTSELVYNGTRFGVTVRDTFWLAFTWTPAFDSATPLGGDLTLLEFASTSSIKFIDSTNEIQFTVGSTSVSTSALSFISGSQVSILLEFRPSQDPNPGLRAVVYVEGVLVSDTDISGIFGLVDLSYNFSFSYNNGYLQQVILKKDSLADIDIEQFVSNPSLYLTPDPLPDGPTTLTNAVFGADFTTSQFAFVGGSSEMFEGKTWSPVWRDYICLKGFLVLPKKVRAKYLKFEFTKLTPQSYPIWDTEIETTYKTFPISIAQISERVKTSYSATQMDSRTGKTKSVDPATYRDREGRFYTNTDVAGFYDVEVQVGAAVLDTVPHTFDTPPEDNFVTEARPSTIANTYESNYNYEITKAEYYKVQKGDTLIGIASKLGIDDWHILYNDNKNLIDKDPRVGKLPKRSPGWWIFPGQELRISDSIMQEFKKVTTVTEQVSSTVNTTRFTITSVHRYDTKTAKRDAGIAYFAGIREVKVYREDLIEEYDTEIFGVQGFVPSEDGVLYSQSNAMYSSSSSLLNLVANPNFAVGPQGYHDLSSEYTADAVTSISLSDTHSFIVPLSLKVVFNTTGSNPQGIFYRISGLPSSSYVGVTARIFVPTGDSDVSFDNTEVVTDLNSWVKVSKVLQADVNGIVDLKFSSVGPPGTADVFYLDAVSAHLVESPISEIHDFFDGDTSGGSWVAFTGDSESVLVGPTGPGDTTSGVMTPYFLVDPATILTNHVTNPSFEVDTSGWTNGLGSVNNVTSAVRSTAEFYLSGVASLLITWPTDTGSHGIGTSLTGLTNGADYVAIGYVKNGAGDSTECYLKVDGVSNGYTSSNFLRNEWQKLEVRWTQTGTTADLILASDTTVDTDITYLDDVAVYKLSDPYQEIAYFDGSYESADWTGTAHASTSIFLNKSSVSTYNWRTLSQFRRIGVTLQGRSLEKIFESLDNVTSLGVGSAGLATWDDPVSTWADPTASWGASSSLAVVDYQSNFFYAGVQSVKVVREAAGVGGLYSDEVTPFDGAHVRGGALLYLPFDTTLTHTLKIVDAGDNSTIHEEILRQSTGGWVYYYTDFYVSDGTTIKVLVQTDGPNASELYVGMFIVQQTTVSIWGSPDGGATFIDLTDIPWSTDPNTFYVFPEPTNQLQVRVEMLRKEDFVHGFTVRPYYLS